VVESDRGREVSTLSFDTHRTGLIIVGCSSDLRRCFAHLTLKHDKYVTLDRRATTGGAAMGAGECTDSFLVLVDVGVK